MGERSEEVGMRQHKTGKQGMVGGGFYITPYVIPYRSTSTSVRLIQGENNK